MNTPNPYRAPDWASREQQAWLDRAEATPVVKFAGETYQIGRFDSVADFWRDCPDRLVSNTSGVSYVMQDRHPAVLRDWNGDTDRARACLSAGVATDAQKAAVRRLVDRVDVGAIVSDFASESCRARFAYFPDADEPDADRVVTGAEVWASGIRRGRITPTVRIGYNTLAEYGFQGVDNYVAFAAVATIVSEVAAALGWALELYYVNAGREDLGNGNIGELGVCVKFSDPSRPFDPEIIASHANPAGHKWGTWAFNCAACERYRREQLVFTSSRGHVENPEALRAYLGLDYFVQSNRQGLSIENMTAGILRGGMSAALQAVGKAEND